MKTPNDKDKKIRKIVGKLYRLRGGGGFSGQMFGLSTTSRPRLNVGQIGMILSAEKFGWGSVRIVWLIGLKQVTAEYWFDDFLDQHIEVT